MKKRFNRRFSRQPKKNHVINDRIYGDEFRVIDSSGEQIGLKNRADTFAHAKDTGVDVVLIAPKAKPPVVKLIEYSKFLYQEGKREKDARRGLKKSATKDVQLSLFIGEMDFERMVKKAEEFLSEGHQVRLRLLLKGREIGKRTRAFELMDRFVSRLENAAFTSPPKLRGRLVIGVIARKK